MSPRGRIDPDMNAPIEAIVGGYLQPRGIRGTVSFDAWPLDTPSFDIREGSETGRRPRP